MIVIAALLLSLEAFPSYTYAFKASPAIGFDASLNATSVVQNQTVRLTLSDINYLPFPNQPSDTGIFRAMNLSSGPCGFASPFGVATYQGRYTLENLSMAKKVEVFDVFSVYFCGPIATGPYRLAPLQTVTRHVDLSGYWTSGETKHPGGGVSEGILHPFPPGVYTLVAADAWGHVKVLYFQVT